MLQGLMDAGRESIADVTSSLLKLTQQSDRPVNVPESPSSASSWRMEDISPGTFRMNEDSSFTDNDLHNCSGLDSNDPVSLLKVLLEEYRQILAHLPSGIVVVPSFHTLLEWHGSVHVKDGFFRGGIFKFVLHVPVDYPASPPSVYFLNTVFHSLVDRLTGRVDITPAFPTWKPGRDYIVLVLSFLKKLFFKRELNTYAATLPKAEFVAKCEECVDESLRLVYVNHANNPIAFSSWPPAKGESADPTREQYEAIINAVEHLPPDLSHEEQAESFANWVIHDLIPSSVKPADVSS